MRTPARLRFRWGDYFSSVHEREEEKFLKKNLVFGIIVEDSPSMLYIINLFLLLPLLLLTAGS